MRTAVVKAWPGTDATVRPRKARQAAISTTEPAQRLCTPSYATMAAAIAAAHDGEAPRPATHAAPPDARSSPPPQAAAVRVTRPGGTARSGLCRPSNVASKTSFNVEPAA